MNITEVFKKFSKRELAKTIELIDFRRKQKEVSRFADEIISKIEVFAADQRLDPESKITGIEEIVETCELIIGIIEKKC